MFDVNPDGGAKTVTVDFDATDAATLSSLVRMGLEHGDPLLAMASQRLGRTMTVAVGASVGGEALETIAEMRDSLAEADLPEGAAEAIGKQLDEVKAGIEAKLAGPELTEEAIGAVDFDALAEQLRGGESS